MSEEELIKKWENKLNEEGFWCYDLLRDDDLKLLCKMVKRETLKEVKKELKMRINEDWEDDYKDLLDCFEGWLNKELEGL